VVCAGGIYVWTLIARIWFPVVHDWNVGQRPVFLFAGLVVELWLVSVDGDGEFVDGFG